MLYVGLKYNWRWKVYLTVYYILSVYNLSC